MQGLNIGGESGTAEFKEGVWQLDEGILSLTAMLNRHNRGTVYLGVDDDGVPTIVRRYGREAFRITDSGVTVTLTFAFEPDSVRARRETERHMSGLGGEMSSILAYLEENPEAKLSSVAEYTGMTLSSVKKAVSVLKSKGYLRNDGTNRNSRWVVLRPRPRHSLRRILWFLLLILSGSVYSILPRPIRDLMAS